MSGTDYREIRQAWQIARQVRGCPPDELVVAESPDENLLAHIEVCTFCHDLRRTRKSAAEEFELARCLANTFHLETEGQIEEGQVRSMSESLAGWGPGKLFYNPPLVLVLKRSTIHGDAVKVAQVHDEAVLSGPGDIEIGAGLFAETWNAYTVRLSWLDRLIAKVPGGTMKTVTEEEAQDVPHLKEHTALKAFRRLEVEVGAFFSTRAVSELMSQRQPDLARVLSAAFPVERALFEHLHSKHPSITWYKTKRSVLESLARAHFPDSEVPLAATGEQRTVSVNILKVHPDEGEADLAPSIAVISVWREHESGCLIGGEIRGRLLVEAELFARMELPDGSLLDPEQTLLHAESGRFRIFFPDIETTLSLAGRLILLAITK